MRRAAGADWPRVLVPAFGHAPPARAPRGDERVVYLANRTPDDAVPGLPAALRALTDGAPGSYREVAMGLNVVPDAELLCAAAATRPTLVFLNPQRESTITAEVIADLRPLCAPGAVVVNWTGDQHGEPGDPVNAWLVALGRACDATLVPNVKHPVEYAALGVNHPGFLAAAADPTTWRPAAPTPDTPAIVCLANRWPTLDAAYAARTAMFKMVAAAHPDGFAVYGRGWEGTDVPARPFLRNADEAGVYAAARAALSASIRADLPRYTSNRLFYALAAGAVVLAERFPDCEGLGLIEGVNCWLWTDPDDLLCLLATVLDSGYDGEPLRAAARELAVEQHAWAVRASELLAIVDAVRGARS